MSVCFLCFMPTGKHTPSCLLGSTLERSLLNPYLVSPVLQAYGSGSPVTPSLRERVDADLDALVASDPSFFSGDSAPAELPQATPDYTRYLDAHASAVKRCDHANAVNVRYAREWHCPDCGKYLSRADLKGSWWMYG